MRSYLSDIRVLPRAERGVTVALRINEPNEEERDQKFQKHFESLTVLRKDEINRGGDVSTFNGQS